MDGDTTLVVLSDHGFELGALPDDPSKTRDMRRVSERFHREQGILYLYGRGVKRARAVDGARILDVAPTVLALAGHAQARDMPGRVLTDALSLEAPGPEVASYESGGGHRAAGRRRRQVDPADPRAAEEPGLRGRQRSPAARAQRRRRCAPPLAGGRAQPGGHALRVRPAPRRPRLPTRKLVKEDPRDSGAAHEPGGSAGCPGPLRRKHWSSSRSPSASIR